MNAASTLAQIHALTIMCSQTAANNPKHIDELLDAFERVGNLVPRFEARPRLSPSSPLLQQTLKLMYSDTIVFCTNATLYYKYAFSS